MNRASASRHRSAGPHHGRAKVIRLPISRKVRRGRTIRAGFGILVMSLFGAILAGLYFTQAAPDAPERISQLPATHPQSRAAGAN
ncbi:MAG TPA: hypothetical protein VMU16_12115 [Candidatus Binataceae bacterium]|nr:hypothetical protein [Candidatus Binataceae bacterium]